jgi:hypothetical protein
VTRKERFDRLWIPEPNSGCWLWMGGTSLCGYGRFWGGDKMYAAHRWSWTHYRGSDPGDLVVQHKCDTSLCVNPDHLTVGTQAENIADKVRKRRQARGERIGTSKLSNAQVDEIRSRLTGRRGEGVRLAREFGVTTSAISGIKVGRSRRAA